MTISTFILSVLLMQAPPFESDIKKFEAQDAVRPPEKGGVVFVGSSSIRLWSSLAKDFPEYNVINRGFGGSQMSDSVRYAHRIVTPYSPKLVVIFAGTNDISSGKSAQTVLSDFQAFVAKVREKLPQVPIVYIGITPAPSRWDKVEEVKQANVAIAAYAKSGLKLYFVDTFNKFLGKDGKPREEFFVDDRLHLSTAGYLLWKDAVGKVVREALPSPISPSLPRQASSHESCL